MEEHNTVEEIESNQLRERADRIDEITDEDFTLVNEDYQELVKEYLEAQTGILSPKTLKQYRSGLKHFFWYAHHNLKQKPLHEITKRDFVRYRSQLISRGLSSSSVNFKRNAVSSFCNYIELMLVGEEEHYDNFRNFTRNLPPVPRNQVYDKVIITREEYEKIMSELLKQKHYLACAWVATAFNSGARRAEIIQFKTEILDYPLEENEPYVISHRIRLKGAGEDGKQERYMLNREALHYMKLWVDSRGYDHPYIFTTKYRGEHRAMSEDWANNLCKNVLSPILGRRINPHIFKASCVTYLHSIGVDIKIIAKYVAHHEDVATTLKFYLLEDDADKRDGIFSQVATFMPEIDLGEEEEDG